MRREFPHRALGFLLVLTAGIACRKETKLSAALEAALTGPHLTALRSAPTGPVLRFDALKQQFVGEALGPVSGLQSLNRPRELRARAPGHCSEEPRRLRPVRLLRHVQLLDDLHQRRRLPPPFELCRHEMRSSRP